MERKPSSYWETFSLQQKLFGANKLKEESLAQWAARLTRLGEETGYEDIVFLDALLRDKFVTGLDPGVMQEYFAGRTDIHRLTFKQVLDVAFTTAAKFEKEQKALAKALANNKT